MHKIFEIRDAQGKTISTMSQNVFKQRFVCHDTRDRLIFTAEEEKEPDDIAMSATTAIRERLVDFKAAEIIDLAIDKIYNRKSSDKDEKTKIKISRTIVIRDSNGNAVGDLALGRHCMLTLYEDRINDPDQRTLLAFGVFLSGI